MGPFSDTMFQRACNAIDPTQFHISKVRHANKLTDGEKRKKRNERKKKKECFFFFSMGLF